MTLEDFKLQQSVQTYSDTKEDTEIKLSGLLGISSSRVQVPFREGFVYVRLRDDLNEIITAYNSVVSPVYNLPVLIKWDKTRYVVVGRDLERYVGWGTTSAYLPLHGASHSFSESGAGDVVWVYSRQFMPWLISPSGSNAAGNGIVHGYPYYFESEWKYLATTGTPSLVGNRPTGGINARMSLAYLDMKENIVKVTASTDEFNANLTGTADILPYIPPVAQDWHIPLAGVRTVTGTSVISWGNLYDLRPHFTSPPTGTGGGSGDVSFDGFKDGSVIFVEDEAAQEDNPNFFYDDSTDTLILGGSGTAHVILPNNTRLSVQGDDGLGIEVLSAGSDYPYINTIKANGSKDSPSVLLSGEILARYNHYGYDGSDYVDKVRTDYYTTEDWSTNARGTKIQIRTTPTGTAGTQAVGEWRGHGLHLLKGFQTGQFVITDSDYVMDGEDCVLIVDDEAEDDKGVTLPPASNESQVVFIKAGGNLGGRVIYSTQGGDTIEGIASGTLDSNYSYIMLIADGTSEWYEFSTG